MTWRAEFDDPARADPRAPDRPVQARIVRTLEKLAANVKALRGGDRYRLLVGDWRVIYSLHDDVLLVLVPRVGHRREVHR